MPDGLWALGPRWAQMGGWVAHPHRQHRRQRQHQDRERERESLHHQWYYTSHSLSLSVSVHLTLWIRTCGHLYAWLCIRACCWICACTRICMSARILPLSSSLYILPHKYTEGDKYIVWFIFMKNHRMFFFFLSVLLVRPNTWNHHSFDSPRLSLLDFRWQQFKKNHKKTYFKVNTGKRVRQRQKLMKKWNA